MSEIHGTTSKESLEGRYIKFQTTVLESLPRDIDPAILNSWIGNAGALKKILSALRNPVLRKCGTFDVELSLSGVGLFDTSRFFSSEFHQIVTFDQLFEKSFSNSYEGDYPTGHYDKWPLHCFNLEFDMDDRSIIHALKRETGESVTLLAEIWSMLLKQKHGESGYLDNSGKTNVFYVHDNNYVLRAVLLRRSDNSARPWQIQHSPLSGVRPAKSKIFCRTSRYRLK